MHLTQLKNERCLLLRILDQKFSKTIQPYQLSSVGKFAALFLIPLNKLRVTLREYERTP